MRLDSLRFDRSSYREDSPLLGTAVFKGADSSIALNLSEEQAKKIMDICAESLEAELLKCTTAMKSALQITLEKRKDEKIGRTIPNHFL